MDFSHKISRRILGAACLPLLICAGLVRRTVREPALDNRSMPSHAALERNGESPGPTMHAPAFDEASRRSSSVLKEGDFVTVTEPNLAFARSDFATGVAFEVPERTPLPRNGETLPIGTAGIVESSAGRNHDFVALVGIHSGPLRGMTLRIPPAFLKTF